MVVLLKTKLFCEGLRGDLRERGSAYDGVILIHLDKSLL